MERGLSEAPFFQLPTAQDWPYTVRVRWQTLYEGRWVFLILFVLILLAWGIHPWIASVPIALFLFTISFFRDPDRVAPADPKAILAPADGVVSAIETLEETEVLNRPAQRIAIFLSVFNVHTNRAPVAGRVTYLKHHPGDYLDARDPECSKRNEAQTWAFENPAGTFVVRQITGAIARRIVPWSKLGDMLQPGERFGMIRFGSRTEIYLPDGCTLAVKEGDAVKGGETIVAHLP